MLSVHKIRFNLRFTQYIDNLNGTGECGRCTCFCRRAHEEPIEEVTKSIL